MKRNNRVLALIIIIALALQMVACSTATKTSEVISGAPENDQVAIYFVVADSTIIMDDEPISFSVICNQYAAVDGSSLNIRLTNKQGNVFYETNETFISGNTYSYVLTPELCEIEMFEDGECTIRVTSSYNSYVGTATTTIEQYPENTVDSPSSDTTGLVVGNDYVNGFFELKFDAPGGYEAYDSSYFASNTTDGYSIDYAATSSDGLTTVYTMVGHIHYENEVEVEDLIDFNSFAPDATDYEVVTINDIDFLQINYETITYYMTVKDTEILIIVYSYYGTDDPNADLMTNGIQSI